MKSPKYTLRKIRACYLEPQSRLVNSDILQLQTYLSLLGELSIDRIQSISEARTPPFDLLITSATHLSAQQFCSWIEGFAIQMQSKGLIWTPAIILAKFNFDELSDIFHLAAQHNWYFDIISPDHLDSLPTRTANLLRIRDHLRELGVYNETLNELTRQVQILDKTVSSLQKN